MKHILIITGGTLDIDFARAYIKTLSYDKVFAVDKGLEYVDALGMEPDYLIGDFDTVQPCILSKYEVSEKGRTGTYKIMKHPPMKDATDTELAIDLAISLHADQITLLAATGSRIDHVLANIGLLEKAIDNYVRMYIVDACNKIQLLSSDTIATLKILKDNQHGKYVSVLPFTDVVKGLTMKGVLYPVDDEEVRTGSSRTVSNEIVKDTMEISIREGQLLVIESRDK